MNTHTLSIPFEIVQVYWESEAKNEFQKSFSRHELNKHEIHYHAHIIIELDCNSNISQGSEENTTYFL